MLVSGRSLIPSDRLSRRVLTNSWLQVIPVPEASEIS
jgi:hypothetical protein